MGILQRWVFPVLLSLACAAVAAQPVRVKDLGRLSSWRENPLVGLGVVTGLAGTGDSPRNKAARQTLANLLSRFDMAIGSDDIQSRNVAVVMVSTSMPVHARPGDTLDASVTSIGDARSLAGGTLLMAPLKGPDGRVYALAQGALTVGGYRYDANNNQVQKNHPTVGLLSGGATVEVDAGMNATTPLESVTFVLHDADYTTAGRIADAINLKMGQPVAQARDAAGVDIQVPAAWRDSVVGFVRQIESLTVEPDRRARVVINERTGTVVTGGDVRITKVAVSHGDLKVSVASESTVSQPVLVRQTGAGVRTQTVTNSQMSVDEGGGARFVPASSSTVAELVQALAKLKTSTRDMIAVLQAIKAAGALHAELIVQ